MVNTMYESPYEFPYRILLFFGVWVIDNKNYYIIKAYFMYKILMLSLVFYVLLKLSFNLYLVHDNFTKITWNMCITIAFGIATVTNLLALKSKEVLNRLRKNLHEDLIKRENKEEYASVESKYLKQFSYIKRMFFTTAIIFVPAWLLTFYFSYLWGPRELPVPAVLFYDADLENDHEYNIAFCIQTVLSILGVSHILCNKLILYSLLVQIAREYEVFLHDIPKMDGAQLELNLNKEPVEEINPSLQRNKMKKIFRELANRQQNLFQYVKDFEMCFNLPLFFHFFAGTLLATVSSMQCILALDNASVSMNLTYQSGYVAIILVDIFLLSWMFSRLKDMCHNVGVSVYSTNWYTLDLISQKDICMIILRSQKHPRITTAKLKEMELNFFMHALGNVYTLLTFFRQMV